MTFRHFNFFFAILCNIPFIWNFYEYIMISCIIDNLYFDKSLNRCMNKCMYLYCNCHAIGMRMRIHIECVFIPYRENVPKTYSCVQLYSCIKICIAIQLTICITVLYSLCGMYHFLYETKQRLQISSSDKSCTYLCFVNQIPHADTEERVRSNTHSAGSL